MGQTFYYSKSGEKFKKPENVKARKRKSVYVYVMYNDVLLLVKAPWDPRNVCLPGGEVNHAEAETDAAIRECLEETGYCINIHEEPIFQGSSLFHDKGIYYNCTYKVFEAYLISTEPKQSIPKDEIASVSWFKPTLLSKKNVHPIFRECILSAVTR